MSEVHVSGQLMGHQVVWLANGSDALYSLVSIVTQTLIAPATIRQVVASLKAEVHLDPDDPQLAALARRLAGRRVLRSVDAELYRALREGALAKELVRQYP